MRTLAELVNGTEPAWPLVCNWVKTATNSVDALPPSDPARSNALLAVQVTTRSPMGAIIYESGGLLIDSGWLRILGSGHPRLPRSLPDWSFACAPAIPPGSPPPFLLVADDIVGGFFAINGGRLGATIGTVHYFAPDTMDWEQTHDNYTAFLSWCFTGSLDKYYVDYRWAGWRTDAAACPGDRAFHIWPPPIASGPPIPERSRRTVPIAELYSLYVGRETSPPLPPAAS